MVLKECPGRGHSRAATGRRLWCDCRVHGSLEAVRPRQPQLWRMGNFVGLQSLTVPAQESHLRPLGAQMIPLGPLWVSIGTAVGQHCPASMAPWDCRSPSHLWGLREVMVRALTGGEPPAAVQLMDTTGMTETAAAVLCPTGCGCLECVTWLHHLCSTMWVWMQRPWPLHWRLGVGVGVGVEVGTVGHVLGVKGRPGQEPVMSVHRQQVVVAVSQARGLKGWQKQVGCRQRPQRVCCRFVGRGRHQGRYRRSRRGRWAE